MKLELLNESGHNEALLGLSLSFKSSEISFEEWWTPERQSHFRKLALTQACKDGGHNKFLESIQVWLLVKAPRGWWQEFDTYRVGMTKNSESTMHTIQRRPLTISDFTPDTDMDIIKRLNTILSEETKNFTDTKRLKGKSLLRVKSNIPEGFLQTRLVCTNYKVLRHMYKQRAGHNYEEWQDFFLHLLPRIQNPQYLIG